MKTKTTLGLVNNIFKSKASSRLEECIEAGEISKKVRYKILFMLEKCKLQIAMIKRIPDDHHRHAATFRSELLHERQKHFIETIEKATYWQNPIHARWLKSIIVGMCRLEIKSNVKYEKSKQLGKGGFSPHQSA